MVYTEFTADTNKHVGRAEGIIIVSTHGLLLMPTIGYSNVVHRVPIQYISTVFCKNSVHQWFPTV